MMARMLGQLPLPLLPAGAAEVAPGGGVHTGGGGGTVVVHGLATLARAAAGKTLREIAGLTGVSTFSVRSALGRVASRSQAPAAGYGDADRDGTPDQRDSEAAVAGKPLPVLPDPVPRDGERALARWG